MKIKDISYRIKVPLMLSCVILLTASLVAFVLSWRVYQELRDELFHVAVEVGSVLSNSLPDAILKDDLWMAYRLIRAAEGWEENSVRRLLIVLDMNGLIYVSNRPKELAPTTELRVHGAELARIEATIFKNNSDSLEPKYYEFPEDKNFYVLLPVISDGVSVGTIIIGYDKQLFWPKFYQIINRIIVSIFFAMIILLPIGWYLGNKIVSPLSQLNYCMSRVGKEKTEDISCDLTLGDDEIGQLGQSFKQMLNELHQKEKMEINMLASERLAAIGRLTAGVAHEINNPLGGMLNALSTFKRYSKSDDVSKYTVPLLERGLKQIRDTVSALLVEANPRSHKLNPEDIEDVHTLLLPTLSHKNINFTWENQIKHKVDIPSTPVRQILMNLALNAINAAYKGKEVMCEIKLEDSILKIVVENEGEEIPQSKMLQLFEPFVGDEKGNGLGLWVTYQLVLQLDGMIEVKSSEGKTRFEVEFLIRESV